MSAICLLDACVLYPSKLRDTLLRVAEAGLVQIKFSDLILDEVSRNLIENGKKTPEKARLLMEVFVNEFPEALVDVPPRLIEQMTNDLKDRHVLAAAVAADAEVIVTTNLKDFGDEHLNPWGVEAQHPDDFLTDLCEEYGTNRLVRIIKEQVQDLKKTPMTLLKFLMSLYTVDVKLPRFSSKLTTYLYAQDVQEIALKCLEIGQRSKHSGENYDIERQDKHLRIFCKTDKREVLILRNNQLVTSNLCPNDVRLFKNAEAGMVENSDCVISES